MTSTWNTERGWESLKRSGAHLEGHFLLTTGRHSNQFFLLARLTEHPDLLEPWAEALAERLKPYQPHAVVGPAVGGIIPAYAVAHHLPGTRVLFAEKSEDGGMKFKRGFRLMPGERVAVVEDAVTTGSSVAKVIDAVRDAGGVPVAVGALVDRSQSPLLFHEPFEALLRVANIPNWDPAACPLCAQGVALSRPKS
ncbi:orotate phosphoribosyltransferase [Sulfobacillus harzensis]|uniref:Orotate phosphoribosyltransferase n=1 Tax=Sulfobacillus harzensis TaxID=2729629 RepID=A0A7Y0Q2Y4_9FIRM|nr:orotate phosphoribosyltransferase [Sulfobacillus harzensis]NMP21649.1 orotate phosphoribosyltransferase [Sulfobacillus harzensis]